MAMFEITDDNVVFTNHRTVCTIMLDSGDNPEKISEKIAKYFPAFDTLKEQHLIETMLMVTNNSTDSKVGYPLQTLYITPSTVEGKNGIDLQMRKRSFDGRIIHVDSDTFTLGKDDKSNMAILIENFVNYFLHVDNLITNAGSLK